jgi:hypothetical protein
MPCLTQHISPLVGWRLRYAMPYSGEYVFIVECTLLTSMKPTCWNVVLFEEQAVGIITVGLLDAMVGATGQIGRLQPNGLSALDGWAALVTIIIWVLLI